MALPLTMNSAAKAPPITVEQFLAFAAPRGYRDELINGEIVLSPDPKITYQEMAYRIHRMLDRLLAGSGFVARQRTNIKLLGTHSMPSPDVFVMDEGSWYGAAGQGYLDKAPLLVIEVMSRSNTQRHITDKKDLFLAHGSRVVWIFHPKTQSVKVWLPESAFEHGPIEEQSSEALRLPAPLSSLSLPLAPCFHFRLPLE